LWRFDIINGQPAATLVTGGTFASLGTKDDAIHTAVATRRFYAEPSVAAVRPRVGLNYLNIAIGSGYRGHPLSVETQDRLYSVRDYDGFRVLTQVEHNVRALLANLVRDTSLQDITAEVAPVVAADAPGWKMTLDQHGGWVGEKSVVAATTFDGKIFYTTYEPNPAVSVSGDPCVSLGTGTNRVYVVNVADGSPAFDANHDGTTTTDDRTVELAQGGIAPQTSILFSDDNNPSPGPGTGPTPPVTCLAGVEVLGVCSNMNRRMKTYWRDTLAE
jgi:type IV pilus assembly protein PilY1